MRAVNHEEVEFSTFNAIEMIKGLIPQHGVEQDGMILLTIHPHTTVFRFEDEGSGVHAQLIGLASGETKTSINVDAGDVDPFRLAELIRQKGEEAIRILTAGEPISAFIGGKRLIA